MNNRARATSVFTSEITLPVVVQAGYRFKNLSKGENSNSLQIFMAFSGGRWRERKSFGKGPPSHWPMKWIIFPPFPGGSFTAAYFALYGGKIFTDFDSQFPIYEKTHVRSRAEAMVKIRK